MVQVQLVSTPSDAKTKLSVVTGLTFTAGTNDSATMTFKGTIANVNAAMAGLTFTPKNGFVGAASLQINTDDLGLTGTGVLRTDTDTIAITILP